MVHVVISLIACTIILSQLKLRKFFCAARKDTDSESEHLLENDSSSKQRRIKLKYTGPM